MTGGLPQELVGPQEGSWSEQGLTGVPQHQAIFTSLALNMSALGRGHKAHLMGYGEQIRRERLRRAAWLAPVSGQVQDTTPVSAAPRRILGKYCFTDAKIPDL